jgi:hypothetical protein
LHDAHADVAWEAARFTGRFALTFDVRHQRSVTLYFAECFESLVPSSRHPCKRKSLRPKPEAIANPKLDAFTSGSAI